MHVRCALLIFLLTIADAGAQISFRQVSAGWSGNYLTRADVNGDGAPDLIGTDYGLYVLLNNGDGTFQPPRRSSTGYSIRSPQAADINRDGRIDIVGCAIDGNSVTGPLIWWGDGAGNFTPSAPLATDGCLAVVVGDMNGDGFADIVSVYQQYPAYGNGVDVFLNDGSGHFSSVVTQGIQISSAYGLCSFGAAAAGDFDHDGHGDLVLGTTCDGTTSSWGTVVFARGDGAGHFAFSTMHEHENQYNDVVRDDANQDGAWDALAYGMGFGPHDTTNAEILLFRNSATGSPISWSETLIDTEGTYNGNGTFLHAGLIADVDGNGAKDVVFTRDIYSYPNVSPEFDLALAQTDGTFGPAQAFPLAESSGSLVAGDFDRDGRIDFAMQSGGNSTTILLNRSAGPTCAADPLFRSVKLCSPAKLSGNTLHLLANTTAGVVTGMRAYIDNSLVLYTPNDLVNRMLPVPNGGHRITVTAWDARGSFSSARWIAVNTSFGCPALSTDRTIDFCFPTGNATIGNPAQIVAAVRTSRVYHGAKIYVDRLAKFSTASKQVSTTLNLALGTHRITVQASDSQGSFSKTAYVTVR